MNYKYYSIMRPVSIGTFPPDNLKAFMNYKSRKMVPEIGREAWGEIHYTERLKDDVAEMYELVKAPTEDE